jgi:hypothetical protein
MAGKGKRRGPAHRTASARARAQELFIATLQETSNVAQACRSAAINRSTAYEWREEDEDFAKRWNEALEIATDALEQEARRRGVEGVVEPVFQGGKKVGVVRRYSDRMLEILLKGHRPRVFGDRLELQGDLKVQHSSGDSDGKPLDLWTREEKLEWMRRNVYLVAVIGKEIRDLWGLPNLASGYGMLCDETWKQVLAAIEGRQQPAAPAGLLSAPATPQKVDPHSAAAGHFKASGEEREINPRDEEGEAEEDRDRPPPFVPGSDEMGWK